MQSSPSRALLHSSLCLMGPSGSTRAATWAWAFRDPATHARASLRDWLHAARLWNRPASGEWHCTDEPETFWRGDWVNWGIWRAKYRASCRRLCKACDPATTPGNAISLTRPTEGLFSNPFADESAALFYAERRGLTPPALGDGGRLQTTPRA